jgi:hypothetical protein
LIRDKFILQEWKNVEEMYPFNGETRVEKIDLELKDFIEPVFVTRQSNLSTPTTLSFSATV